MATIPSPEDWKKIFNPEKYAELVNRRGEGVPLIPLIDTLAWGLEQRGAKRTGMNVRMGGYATQIAILENEEDKHPQIHSFLNFLDNEVGEGVKEENSPTGQSVRILCLTLQMLE